ncbi:hypothetical protein ACHAW5_008519 [Stephanodiscus triporus]|uniref:MBD domain-containing protein n=1 Tax=Stephanodiscus triporus TaxID=2934178 RepID=A0ABD3PSV3_9STRA
MPSRFRRRVEGGIPNGGNAAVRPGADARTTHHDDHSASSAENEREMPRPVNNVILSFRNNYYKDIMWRHFRMLGKARDKVSETRIGNEIFSLLKQNMGESGIFLKYEGARVFELNDEKALAKIMADIYRRNKDHPLWSKFPGKSPGKEKQEQISKPRDSKHSVQLFAFDIEQVENNDMGLRPKRKLKSSARFDSVSFDMVAPSCKIGEGFACPRCSAICSYDSRACEVCQLQCYYEAGIGVVVLKERQARVEQDRNLVPLIHEKVARRVETKKMESKKSRCSSEEVFHDSSHFTYGDDAHNPDQPAEGLPDGWIVRKIPRDSGHRCDNYWYSPKKRYKFRTKSSVQNFLMCLEKTDGNESDAMTLCKNYSNKSTMWDNNAAKALVEMANQKNGIVSEESRRSKQPFIESSPPKEKVISDFALATAPVRAGDDDSASVNRGITPVLVHLYSNELKPDGRDCVKLPRRSVSAHAAGVELSNRQEKIDAAKNTGFANQFVTLQGTHVEMANRLRENEAALIAAETTIASRDYRLQLR